MTATHAADAILAAVLPAGTAAVRIAEGVATSVAGEPSSDTVVCAGADDVGSAQTAIVILDADAGGLDTGAGGRLAVRVRDHAAMRLRAGRTRRQVAARGFATTVIPWDRGQVAHLPAPARSTTGLRAAERLPRRAVVVGHRATRDDPTILAASVAASGFRAAAAGEGLPWPLVRSGTLVALGDEVVLRVGIGAGRARLRRAHEVLERLSVSFDRPELLPEIVGDGHAGLGEWTTERRLRGARSPAELAPRVADDVLDVLAALHAAGKTAPADATDAGEAIASTLGAGSRADDVLLVAKEIDEELQGLPGALGHGDFWHGNLLLDGDRLAGVIDWDAGGDGRLPFADALHLVVTARVPRGSVGWGVEVARELTAAPSPLVRRHAEAVRIPVDGAMHRALVGAYWLERLATQLSTYADRVVRPRWLATNVDPVLAAWKAARR